MCVCVCICEIWHLTNTHTLRLLEDIFGHGVLVIYSTSDGTVLFGLCCVLFFDYKEIQFGTAYKCRTRELNCIEKNALAIACELCSGQIIVIDLVLFVTHNLVCLYLTNHENDESPSIVRWIEWKWSGNRSHLWFVYRVNYCNWIMKYFIHAICGQELWKSLRRNHIDMINTGAFFSLSPSLLTRKSSISTFHYNYIGQLNRIHSWKVEKCMCVCVFVCLCGVTTILSLYACFCLYVCMNEWVSLTVSACQCVCD